jgi:hypothetical protein
MVLPAAAIRDSIFASESKGGNLSIRANNNQLQLPDVVEICNIAELFFFSINETKNGQHGSANTWY